MGTLLRFKGIFLNYGVSEVQLLRARAAERKHEKLHVHVRLQGRLGLGVLGVVGDLGFEVA